jgi:hypothetical protein
MSMKRIISVSLVVLTSIAFAAAEEEGEAGKLPKHSSDVGPTASGINTVSAK